MKVSALPTSSASKRRARTRSLVQLGGLLEHAETLSIFNIPLGVDLQSDPSVKNNIAALFKAFLTINEMVASKELDLEVLALQGLEAFKTKGLSETRPLDRKRYEEIEADSGPNEFANDNTHIMTDEFQEFETMREEEM